MRQIWQTGSFTIEAAIWIPIIFFFIIGTMKIGIVFFQNSIEKEISARIVQLDVVQEFYNYQIVEEIGEEVLDD